MKAKHTRDNEGVALIIVLGLLAVLTLLAVAFAIAMRVERLAARNYADLVRAKHLIQVGLIRAVEDIDDSVRGQTYPCWTNRNDSTILDAMCSTGTEVCRWGANDSILGGEASNAIPRSLWEDATDLVNDCCWIDIVTTNGTTVTTNGRVGYLVVNCSGLLDVNYVGGNMDRSWYTNISQIDLSGLPEFDGATRENVGTARDPIWVYQFFSDRTDKYRRFETITELAALNTETTVMNVPPVSNFFVYSFDPGRDALFLDDADKFGTRDANLQEKFNLHSITNYSCYTNSDRKAYRSHPAFMSEYYDELVKFLKGEGLGPQNSSELWRPDDVAWNIINYLDTNKVIQSGSDNIPWVHSEGCEPIPMINEIVLRTNAPPPGLSNHYEFVVELWHPFWPVETEASDNFALQIGVFTNFVGKIGGTPGPAEFDDTGGTNDVMGAAKSGWSYNIPVTEKISGMAYDTPTEFLCYTSPTISFKSVVGPATNCEPISAHPVYFLARVVKVDAGGNVVSIIDEAMGYKQDAKEGETRSIQKFDDTIGYSVETPRSNGQQKYWGLSGYGTPVTGIKYTMPSANETLGLINTNCNPWTRKGGGLPILFRNDLLKSIGEIGCIWASNLDGEEALEQDYYWQTINLMNYDQGAFLLDRLTIRSTNVSTRGLISISSGQKDAMKALFHNMKIGTNHWYTLNTDDPDDTDDLVDSLVANGPYICFQDMFTSNTWNGGSNGVYFARCAPDLSKVNDILKEGTFRNIIDMISFRQNIFTIIIAAQALAQDGNTILAEKRGAATVYRDSYTGRSFLRSFKWLTD